MKSPEGSWVPIPQKPKEETPDKKEMSRRGFLRALGIFTTGAIMLPKVLRAEGHNTTETTEQEYYVLGQKVQVIFTKKGGEGDERSLPLYFNMHDNEQTSVDAARNMLGEFGGKILELRHTGERLITGTYVGRSFRFDPNRVFTSQGVVDTLEKYNPKPIPVGVILQVENFGRKLLNDYAIGEQKTIIALHNNFEGTALSIQSYGKGGSQAPAAKEVYINPKEDPDNFFYVTKESDFNEIKQMGYNVVLQSNTVPDDGSLSVVAAQYGVRYINAEAEHHHTDKQEKMLRDIQPILGKEA